MAGIESYLVMRRRSKNDGLPARRGMEPECPLERGRECTEGLEWELPLEDLERELADDDPLDDLELPELPLDDEPLRDLKD